MFAFFELLFSSIDGAVEHAHSRNKVYTKNLKIGFSRNFCNAIYTYSTVLYTTACFRTGGFKSSMDAKYCFRLTLLSTRKFMKAFSFFYSQLLHMILPFSCLIHFFMQLLQRAFVRSTAIYDTLPRGS